MKTINLEFKDGFWYASLCAITGEVITKIDTVSSDNLPGLIVEIGNKKWVETVKSPENQTENNNQN